MEFEAEFIRENKSYKCPPLLCENYEKPSKRCDLIIPIDQTPSPKTNYLQDFHPIDHDFNHFLTHNGSSSNPNFSSQTASFDPFEPYTHAGNSPNNLGYSGQSLTNNFQTSGDYNCLNLPCRNPIIDDMIINSSGSDWSCLPLNCQDIIEKPMSFVAPNQDQAISCITAENGCYKKVVAMNKSSITRTSLTKKKTFKGQNIKTNSVKGQWKGEEDR